MRVKYMYKTEIDGERTDCHYTVDDLTSDELGLIMHAVRQAGERDASAKNRRDAVLLIERFDSALMSMGSIGGPVDY